MRYAVCALSMLLLLTACERYAMAPAAQMQALALAQQPGGDAFAYSHSLQLEMDRDMIMPRFERARDSCLQDQAISCTVLSASARMDERNAYRSSYAQLVVLVPHDMVAPFEQRLLQLIEGERAGPVSIRSRSTDVGNVTTESTDIDQRLVQLTDYRDRLSGLMNRRDASVDELIKLAGELSSAQSNVEQFSAKKRDVAQRVAKDRLSIGFSERAGVTAAMLPLVLAWGNGLETLSESAANALTFVIAIIPWLPIIALAFYFLLRLLQIVRKRRQGAAAA
jgi:hypothetical protein